MRASGWQLLDFRELYTYRDLFRFLVRREIKVRYAQSAIGVGWAVLQPLSTMLIFTVIFGRLASISSDGMPYALFSFAGLVPWLYFSNSVTDGVNSLIANAQMLSKVYFPRMFLPLSAVAARLIDFAVAGTVMVGLMAWYGFTPTWGLLALPWILVLMVISAAGVALWLATFAVQFRDVKHALGFVVQVLMYTTPVVYPASLIPRDINSGMHSTRWSRSSRDPLRVAGHARHAVGVPGHRHVQPRSCWPVPVRSISPANSGRSQM